MGGLLKLVLTAVRRLDMFPSGQYLRYKSQPVYRSLTGGIISIVILAIFVALFASEAIETLNKQIIFSTERLERQLDPDPALITFSPTDGFMFSLTINGGTGAAGVINLQDPSLRYFDINLKLWQMQPDYSFLATQIPLVSCTLQHFSQSEETKKLYIPGLTNQTICPPLNYSGVLGGSRVSAGNSWFELTVKKCNQSLYQNCISDEDLEQLQRSIGGQFENLILLSGKTVNPENSVYKEVFIQTRNYLSFTLTNGITSDIFIQESIVKTDESLSPIQDIHEDRVISIDDYTISRPLSTEKGNLMTLRMSKSPLQRTYHRSFQKVDKFFSYVGGIIGTIIGVLFVLNFYSRQGYSISIASQLYLSEEGEKISSRAFHLGYFLLIPLKRLLNMICCCSIKWERTDFYTRCMDEANQQLDVMTMMKKIIFLQKAMSLLFTKHQLESLYLFQRERIDQAEARRKKHELGRKINAKKNQVCPIEGPVNLEDEVDGPNLNPLNQVAQVLEGDDELSQKSVSGVNARSQERIKTYLKTVMKESLQGNKMSSRIAMNIDPKVLASMGVDKKDVAFKEDCVVGDEETGENDSKLRMRGVRLEPIDRKGRKGLKTVSFSKGPAQTLSEETD